MQFDLSYDLNYLATLKNGVDVFEGENRQRITHSLLFKAGYAITDRIAVDGLFSYVNQRRAITYFEETNETSTNGVGDAVVLGKIILSRLSHSGTELQIGIGPKIPFGRTNLTDARGITLNADLQPGSGSWDLIGWGYFIRQLKGRPTATLSGRFVGRINGSNNAYLGSQTYQFGNSFQIIVGIGDQVTFGQEIISPSVSFRYRKTLPDKVNEHPLDNTGGEWISLIPAIGWYINPRTVINIIPEIPLYSNLEGVQLTPTFRMQLGVYYTLNFKQNVNLKKFEL